MTPPDRPVSARLEELRCGYNAAVNGQFYDGHELAVVALHSFPALLDIAEAADGFLWTLDRIGLAPFTAADRDAIGTDYIALRAALDRLSADS